MCVRARTQTHTHMTMYVHENVLWRALLLIYMNIYAHTGKHDSQDEIFEKIKEEWQNRLAAIKKFDRSISDAEAAIAVGIKVVCSPLKFEPKP